LLSDVVIDLHLTHKVLRDFRNFLSGKEEGITGISAVEFAMIAPVIALMMVATIDLGIGFYRRMQVQNAAQAGVGFAMVHGFASNSIANAIVTTTNFSGVAATPAPAQFCACPSSTGLTPSTCDVTAKCPGGSAPGTYVTAAAEGTYTPLFQYPMLSRDLKFTAQSTVRIR
jgi:Flp pilus assembly protein TadG